MTPSESFAHMYMKQTVHCLLYIKSECEFWLLTYCQEIFCVLKPPSPSACSISGLDDSVRIETQVELYQRAMQTCVKLRTLLLF